MPQNLGHFLLQTCANKEWPSKFWLSCIGYEQKNIQKSKKENSDFHSQLECTEKVTENSHIGFIMGWLVVLEMGDVNWTDLGNCGGMKTDAAKLNLVIGAGGKTIKSIIESTGVESVDVSDDGSVSYPIPSLLTEFLQNCIWLVTFKSAVAEFPLQSDIHVYEVCILLCFVG